MRSLNNAAKCFDRHVATKKVNIIFNDLLPVQSVRAPFRTITPLPFRAPSEHLTFGRMQVERRTIKEEILLKEAGMQKSSPCRKSSEEGQEVSSEGEIDEDNVPVFWELDECGARKLICSTKIRQECRLFPALYLITYFIATPPYRGWQRSEGR